MTAPGYIFPSSTVQLPKQLNLTQFIQTVLVGVSGLPGGMVRPKWQKEPPDNPDIEVNWLAFGIEVANPDANAYVGINTDNVVIYQRHEELEISCDIYGPEALETVGFIRDGFQIDQNRFALFNANMGFVNVSGARRIPDLVNERFVNRRIMTVNLRREIQRTYSIPTLISASGVIHTVIGNEEYLLPFATGA